MELLAVATTFSDYIAPITIIVLLASALGLTIKHVINSDIHASGKVNKEACELTHKAVDESLQRLESGVEKLGEKMDKLTNILIQKK